MRDLIHTTFFVYYKVIVGINLAQLLKLWKAMPNKRGQNSLIYAHIHIIAKLCCSCHALMVLHYYVDFFRITTI